MPPRVTPGGRTTPGGAGPRTPRGRVIVLTRGPTSKQRLQIAWDVPVYDAPVFRHTGVAGSLTRDAAFAFIRGEDRRPLLVMRECRRCSGTDYALLRRAANNERTMLLTRWFHCVRLPASVLEKDHPLRRLFPEEKPPHLFFASTDGKEIVTLPGDQVPSSVWKGMTKILRKTYAGNSTKTVKLILGVLDAFDTLDGKQMALRRRLDQTLENEGPKSKKFKTLKARFDKLEVRRRALLKKEAKLIDLGLK